MRKKYEWESTIYDVICRNMYKYICIRSVSCNKEEMFNDHPFCYQKTRKNTRLANIRYNIVLPKLNGTCTQHNHSSITCLSTMNKAHPSSPKRYANFQMGTSFSWRRKLGKELIWRQQPYQWSVWYLKNSPSKTQNLSIAWIDFEKRLTVSHTAGS